jgi:hypothetical protein
MSGEWDELAQAAAGALVTALASDSGDEAERWFAGVIGQQRRLSATRAELAAAVGPDRERVMQSAITAWTYRLRDILEENPAAAEPLRGAVAARRRAIEAYGATETYGLTPTPARNRRGALAAIGVVVLVAVLAVIGWQAHWPPALFPAASSPTLPAGTGSVLIKSTPTDVTYNSAGQPTGPMSDGNLILQKEQGTIDGLALEATGEFDLAQYALPSRTSEYCEGYSGEESIGTLGGTPYHVVMTCVRSAKPYPAYYQQTYTGEWGDRPIHLTATISSGAETPARLSGTIGGQTVTATINLTNAGVINPPPGVKPYNREAGTMTVS